MMIGRLSAVLLPVAIVLLRSDTPLRIGEYRRDSEIMTPLFGLASDGRKSEGRSPFLTSF